MICYFYLMALLFSFWSYMTAYDVNWRYKTMSYRFKRARRSDLRKWYYLCAFPDHTQKNVEPFLLTVDGEKLSILYFALNIFLIPFLYLLLDISKLKIWWCFILLIATPCIGIQTWVRHTSKTVINLSQKNNVTESERKRHVRKWFNLVCKERSSPECRVEIKEACKHGFLWETITWTVAVYDNAFGILAESHAVACQKKYRYYDGYIVQLFPYRANTGDG